MIRLCGMEGFDEEISPDPYTYREVVFSGLCMIYRLSFRRVATLSIFG
jgi:hypothetical protein